MGKLEVKAHQIDIKCNHGYWTDRILHQIKYAIGLSAIRGGKYDGLIEQVEDYLLAQWKNEKNLSADAAKHAEAMLAPLSEDAKSFTLHCISHAHIDMNWMWRFDETVAITLDTFRTMLDLLGEYPMFTFAQSQASVYRIVEEYGPDGMLDEIRKHVKEGRWEVTASTWVEADKNMPNGESMARHQLYARRYLSKLLGLPDGAVRIDFEPDTFGHSARVPETLVNAGIEYYYHCRGSEDPQLVWWEGQSGSRVLAIRDHAWYNCIVDAAFTTGMMDHCKTLGIDTMLKVYGVGDHGGGPSRRDIERIIDMQSWPVHPTILFSTYHAFFDDVKNRFGDVLPVHRGELNSVFNGCYTTQARIKMANRISEATLYEAELLGTVAATKTDYQYHGEKLFSAWEKVLFNQFHDILTGSGTVDTREYAMGQFQKTMAVANHEKLMAMRALAASIDTSCYITEEDVTETRTEGAGVGCGVYEFKCSQVDRGCGSVRVYHVFNPSPYDREGMAEISVWDWNKQELGLAEFRDEAGHIVPHQLLRGGTEHYWGHEYMIALIPVKVPASGYATYTLHVSEENIIPFEPQDRLEWQVRDAAHEYVLENDLIRICFDTQEAHIISYVDKKSGKDWIKPGAYGCFRLIDEDPCRGMTSWRIGRHMNIYEFESVHIKPIFYSGAKHRQAIQVEAKWRRSLLRATFSLDSDSCMLNINAECDWNENAVRFDSIPQLNFALPLAGDHDEYCFDIPFGSIIRESVDLDLPAISFVSTLPSAEQEGFMLSSNCKYGYRGFDNTLSVALIRMAYDPDPTPEYGLHRFQLAIGPAANSRKGLIDRSFALWRPFSSVPSSAHEGSLPLHSSFVELESDGAVLQSVKIAEDGGSMIVKLYDAADKGGQAKLKLNLRVADTAELVDLHEKPVGQTLPVCGGVVTVDIGPGTVKCIRIPLV